MNDNSIEFGWFLPTAGDTTAYGLPEASVETSPEYLARVAQTAEDAGFEYMLIPVDRACWEAYITGAFIAAGTRNIARRARSHLLDGRSNTRRRPAGGNPALG